MALRKFPIELNKLSWSSTKDMSWDTEVQTSGSGKVRTMTNLLLPKWTIETKFAHLTDAEYRKLLGFVALCKGAFEPFLWKDPEDYQETKRQLPMVTAGTYQGVMVMGDYVEPVEYIEDVMVWVDDVLQASTAYSIVNGCVVFKTAPSATAIVKASYTYWWKVMFKGDGMTIERVFQNINRSKSFKLVTVR